MVWIEKYMLQNADHIIEIALDGIDVDVYVTRSNSRFLSKDIITEFRGRGDEILSFKYR